MDAKAKKMSHEGSELVYCLHYWRSDDGKTDKTHFNFSQGYLRLEVNRKKWGRGIGFKREFSSASEIEVIAEAPEFGGTGGNIKIRVLQDQTEETDKSYVVETGLRLRGYKRRIKICPQIKEENG